MIYTQHLALCEGGQVDRAVKVWQQWSESKVGTNAEVAESNIFHGAAMSTLSTNPKTLVMAQEMLENMISVPICENKTWNDTRPLGAALTCAKNAHRFDLAERAWEWAKPMRKYLLLSGDDDCDLAIQYAKYVTFCSQHGLVQEALEVWCEWRQLPLGLQGGGGSHGNILQSVVMTFLSNHTETVSVASDVLNSMISDNCEPEIDTRDIGSALKCAANIGRVDLVERVWQWAKPMQQYRLRGGKEKVILLLCTHNLKVFVQNMDVLTFHLVPGESGPCQKLILKEYLSEVTLFVEL